RTGTTGWATTAMTYANQFLIGDTPDTSDGGISFSGLIDEVYVFNRALSQTEVANLMANQKVDPPDVVTGQLPIVSPVSLASGATLDLTGISQTIASLSDVSGSGGLVTNSVGTVTLTLSSGGTNTFSGPIASANAINLVKNGTGMQTLNGANNYSGNTTVNAGTLAFGQPTLPSNATVTVASSAVLNLNFAGTNPVSGLVLNGVSQPPGTFDATNSAPYLAGTGSLLIATPIATSPPNISFSLAGSGLMLSWPSDHTGWHLQMQTNALVTGLGTNWTTVANSTGTNQIFIPTGTGDGSAFFRLISP
ncbi:MAG: autotransporter-associated beta strand repeat-containing protein, partial [Verrucomicrobia bacterium]|nr:autotransporter-associated beta strand repeat-containing protein [Verrucomicrobiota bacterium]